jgi:hypothetical protein
LLAGVHGLLPSCLKILLPERGRPGPTLH